jgi:hypothetical protein
MASTTAGSSPGFNVPGSKEGGLQDRAPLRSRQQAEEYERQAISLEMQQRYEEALAVCEQALRTLDAGHPDLEQIIAQFEQRRLRLRRKLGLPTYSTQRDSRV